MKICIKDKAESGPFIAGHLYQYKRSRKTKTALRLCIRVEGNNRLAIVDTGTVLSSSIRREDYEDVTEQYCITEVTCPIE